MSEFDITATANPEDDPCKYLVNKFVNTKPSLSEAMKNYLSLTIAQASERASQYMLIAKYFLQAFTSVMNELIPEDYLSKHPQSSNELGINRINTVLNLKAIIISRDLLINKKQRLSSYGKPILNALITETNNLHSLLDLIKEKTKILVLNNNNNNTTNNTNSDDDDNNDEEFINRFIESITSETVSIDTLTSQTLTEEEIETPVPLSSIWLTSPEFHLLLQHRQQARLRITQARVQRERVNIDAQNELRAAAAEMEGDEEDWSDDDDEENSNSNNPGD